jgi:hypothetical protein
MLASRRGGGFSETDRSYHPCNDGPEQPSKDAVDYA